MCHSAISIGKFGSFPTNLIIGRPFYLTFEIQDKTAAEAFNDLRVVSAQELHAETAAGDHAAPEETRDVHKPEINDGVEFEVVDDEGNFIIKNNRLTVDEASRQSLSMQEIEDLKNAAVSSSGRDTIAKIMKSHSALDEKTEFSLAKYTLRKTKKYLKRFTVLPLDVNLLTKWMTDEKDATRVFELREEMLGLIASWSNIHKVTTRSYESDERAIEEPGNGRWLIVDDTGGLLVALAAEKLGILYPESATSNQLVPAPQTRPDEEHTAEFTIPSSPGLDQDEPNGNAALDKNLHSRSKNGQRPFAEPMSVASNTLTLLHSAGQANLALLTYFNYDPYTQASSASRIQSHPLYTHLKTLSWLQLVSPELDPSYSTAPSPITESTLAALKSSKRGAYFRKRRRWERTRRVVDETRAGGFEGLLVASSMRATSVLHHTVPLLKGGAQIAVYSPNIEPLTDLMDAYSTERKTGYLTALGYTEQSSFQDTDSPSVPSDDFPLDPRLLLAPTVQSARATPWQVLPGRTHPQMISRGGAEGYLFTATRVIPIEGKISAKGKFGKKRKVDETAINIVEM